MWCLRNSTKSLSIPKGTRADSSNTAADHVTPIMLSTANLSAMSCTNLQGRHGCSRPAMRQTPLAENLQQGDSMS